LTIIGGTATRSVVGATKHWSKTSPDVRWDYIVIGSGMGGMTTAALLAKLGKRVLVLEQHYVPGGFTHMFKRPGYIWDVGVHAVGEVSEKTMTGRLLHRLTDGELQWASLGEVYDEFHFPDLRIDFPNTPQKFRDNLVEAFPDEAKGIDEYLYRCREVASGMKGYYLARTVPQSMSRPMDWLLARKVQKELTTSTASVINELTSNEKLRTVLCSQWGYYGSPPERSSFAMQALVCKHFLWGGFYPYGGAQEIARGLLGTVARAGGWTRIRADVGQILVERDTAVGVRLKSGEVIRAGRIVSAAGVMSTVARLLPDRYRQSAWVRTVSDLKPAPAHVCLYIGFKGDIRKAGAGSANKWFYNVWQDNRDNWDISDPDNLEHAGILYTSFPSLKDPRHDPGPEERHTGEIVTFVPFDAFTKWQDERWRKRGESYEELKAKLADSLLDGLLHHMPELKPMVDYVELSTPLSTDHFCRPMAGSIYGIEPTPTRFHNDWLRPRSPITNLFFSGSEVTTVGVMGAMMGGVLGATAAEPWAALNYLRKV